jgi:hypothetical protein
VVDHATPVRAAAQALRDTLRLNAATSLAGGIVAAAAAGPLDRLLETGQVAAVRVVGVGLIGFATALVAVSGASIRRLVAVAPWVSAADLAWVAASAATIIIGWFATAGDVVLAGVAAVVAGFGLAQLIHVRRTRHEMRTAPAAVLDEAPPTEIAHASGAVDVDHAVAWRTITDHELFGRLAPNLSGVRVTAPNGPGLTRTCANRAGDEWQETCTRWDDGAVFEVEVDTSDYPYPLDEMRGSWWAAPGPPTRIGMDYRYRPARGIRGRLFATAVRAVFPIVLRRIRSGWRSAMG